MNSFCIFGDQIQTDLSLKCRNNKRKMDIIFFCYTYSNPLTKVFCLYTKLRTFASLSRLIELLKMFASTRLLKQSIRYLLLIQIKSFVNDSCGVKFVLHLMKSICLYRAFFQFTDIRIFSIALGCNFDLWISLKKINK